MGFGMKINFILLTFKFIAAVVSGLVIVLIHNYGHSLYMENFIPQSHGITLGFVRFYILYIMLPSLFIMVFTSNKIFIFTYFIIMFAMFSLWFSSHPLRIYLLSISYSTATWFLFLIKHFIEKSSLNNK